MIASRWVFLTSLFLAMPLATSAQESQYDVVAPTSSVEETNSSSTTTPLSSPLEQDHEGEEYDDAAISPSEEPDANENDTDEETESSAYEQALEAYKTTIREEDFTSKVKLLALNKITARTHVLEIEKDKAASFGNLEITLRQCWRAPETQIPESKALLFIEDKIPGQEVKTVFEGWMFASSPSISAVEHPVYDVRVLECINGSTKRAD